jgi:hypothetical protein
VLVEPKLMPELLDAHVRADLFSLPDHQRLWLAIRNCYTTGAIDVPLVRHELAKHCSDPTDAGPIIACVLQSEALAANWLHYVAITREHAGKRRTRLIAEDMLVASANGESAAGIAARAQEALEEIKCGSKAEETAGASAIVVNMGDVVAKPVHWLWHGRIALGKLTLVSGDPGLGKSFLSLDIASRVSNGAKWPDCGDHAPKGGVVILSAEDDLEDTIRPRLDAAGADVSKIVAVQGVQFRDDLGDRERSIDLQRDLPILEQAIERMPNCKLVVVDPVSAYMGGADSHKDAEVRGVLAPLATMAAKRGFAVLAITHLRKSEGRAVHRTMGSLAFAAAARAVWAVASDPEDSSGSRRLFLPVKNNIGNDRTGLAYRLCTRFAESSGQPCVEWFADAVSQSADDVLAPQRRRGPAPEERDEAIEFLREALAAGPRLADEVTEEAKQSADISARTLSRAKKSLGVVSFRPTAPGKWFWKMPETDANE